MLWSHTWNFFGNKNFFISKRITSVGSIIFQKNLQRLDPTNIFSLFPEQKVAFTMNFLLVIFLLMYGFCSKSFRKEKRLTSLLFYQANPHISEDKYVEKVFNWSEVHLSEMTCYKIHTLVWQGLLIFVIRHGPLWSTGQKDKNNWF